MPGVFTSPEIDALITHVSASDYARSRAGIRHMMHDPAVSELAQDPRLVEITRDILGDKAFPFRATLFDKSPASNWLVVWHQDTALPIRQKYELAGWGPWSLKDGVDYAHAPASALEQILAIRIQLDDSNSDNGPLRVLPGTHDCGVLGDDAIHKLSTEIEPVDCTVLKGGIVLMRPLIVHASSKSATKVNRRVLHIEYTAQSCLDGLELAIA